ncbi:LysE family translocator [Microvirga rosea]|uniref:LysE family translocator n=1 Tax=Microvirga rosea TaxID=2715425 RepID=UPI001D0A7C07|nr:LysE family translocator [Microvirga rosea]MCB8823537.1 LysE family translocator [Microvirga rosea]
MTTTAMIAYAAALLVDVAAPGPAMFGVISTGLARGTSAAITVGLGLALGDILLVSAVLLGLVAIAATFEWVFSIVKYAGAAYLIWIGIKMWRSKPERADSVQAGSGRPLWNIGLGATMALGNPTGILFHVSLMPLLVDLGALTILDAGIILGIVFMVNALTMGVYGLLSGRVSSWFQPHGRVRWVNRIAGSAMVGIGAVIASR